jgi:hypothetical protein
VLRSLDEAGYTVDFATPGGRVPTIDVHGFKRYFYDPLWLVHGQTREAEIATAEEFFGALHFSDHDGPMPDGVGFVSSTSRLSALCTAPPRCV